MKTIAAILLIAGLIPLYTQAITLKQEKPGTNPPSSFLLKGKIRGQKSGFLKLSYPVNGKYIQDSCAIVNGTFSFKGELTEPTMAYLIGAAKNGWNDPNFTSFYLEPGQLEMEVTAGAFKQLKLKGSKTHNELSALEETKSAINKELSPLRLKYDVANEAYMKAMQTKQPDSQLIVLKERAQALHEQMEPYFEKNGAIDLAFMKSHPDSYHAANLLNAQVSSMPLDSSKKYYALLPQKIKESSYGKQIAVEIKALQAGSPGSIASAFSAKEINGGQLSLAEFKDKKYVLIDFWASWCVPCRKGNPHLLALYSKYKEKGLEIIGISDDDSNPEAWRKAVEKDGIGVWKHVLRGLKRVGNDFDRSEDISDGFGIHSLPTKILVDKNGIIIGRYGGGGEGDEAMDAKFAEIFK